MVTKAKRRMTAGVLIAISVGCAPVVADVDGMMRVDDPREAAARLAAGTTPDHPLTIRFDWTIDEPDLRARGQGVLRIEAPERLRVDLFGPRGDTYLVAALVEDRFRLPPAAAALDLPPAPLFWAALGVVRPPDGADIEAFGEEEDGKWALRFTAEEGVVRIAGRTEGDRPVVESAALERGGRTLATVVHTAAADGAPRRAVYHDRTEDRRLAFDITRVERSEPFPPDTWRPFG